MVLGDGMKPAGVRGPRAQEFGWRPLPSILCVAIALPWIHREKVVRKLFDLFLNHVNNLRQLI